MRAAILAVGSEMLGTERLDTNSLRITALFERYGVELIKKSVIGDGEGEIAEEVSALLARVPLVVITGGLGPTADDVTREAVAAALGRGLTLDEGIVETIAARYRSFRREMPAVNRRQAMVIDGAAVLTNRRGTAPGLRVEPEGKTLFLFPGVPFELEAMLTDELEPWLASRSGGRGRETAVLKLACVPESAVEERIAPAYDEFGREWITILAKPGEVQLHATAEGSDSERRSRLVTMTARLRELAGDAVFTESADQTLEAVVGALLGQAGATLAVAESCTGGLLAERITSVPGSSDYFVGGAVVYSNRLKSELLGVPAELIAEHGAVSEPVARSLAQGARSRLGADFGIGITGVAGPSGGSDEKPVGTVHLAVAGPRGLAAKDAVEDGVEHRCVRFPGDRERIRQQASQLALELLRRRLLGTQATESAIEGWASPDRVAS